MVGFVQFGLCLTASLAGVDFSCWSMRGSKDDSIELHFRAYICTLENVMKARAIKNWMQVLLKNYAIILTNWSGILKRFDVCTAFFPSMYVSMNIVELTACCDDGFCAGHWITMQNEIQWKNPRTIADNCECEIEIE